jgi:lipoprotein-anchoring transpeptidase ErfK/SrfK
LHLISLRTAAVGCLLVLLGGAGVYRVAAGDAPVDRRPTVISSRPSATDTATRAAVEPAPAVEPVPVAVAAPKGLPKIDYFGVPDGFPADPDASSPARIAEALHPERKLAVYDAPGGKPRAFLPRRISGLDVVVPIVAKRAGWVAVLLPSVDRRVGWLPGAGWSLRAIRDQLLVDLRAHRLTWLRDGRAQHSWTVATGAAATPTPYGRTFVLGRTGTHGSVYAGLDALVLGAVPEKRHNLAPGLRDGHTGIHAWVHTKAFGHSVSNGCIRMPAAAQRTLLHHLGAGTTVHVG